MSGEVRQEVGRGLPPWTCCRLLVVRLWLELFLENALRNQELGLSLLHYIFRIVENRGGSIGNSRTPVGTIDHCENGREMFAS